jgi:predicted dehydrogenase
MNPNLTQVLVVGVGSIGERHVRCFQATGRAEISICEISDDRRAAVADQYQVAQSFSDFHQALESGPAAAVICTPAHLHVPMARSVAERDIHVLIEKPLSTTLDGVENLLQEIESQQIVAGVAYVIRHHPALGAMRDAIRDQRFGRPVQLSVQSGQHFPHYRPAYRETYYADLTKGGGAIQDAMTHMINLGEWLLGPIIQLAADAAHQVLKGVDVEDTVHVIARHEDVLANYCLNQYQAPLESNVTVVCERGTVRCNLVKNYWSWMTTPASEWQIESFPEQPRDELFRQQADVFLNCLQGEQTPPCGLEDGLQTLRCNLAIQSAVRLRQWIHPLPPPWNADQNASG